MSGIKDTATVTLNVNGTQAKQMMSDLEAKIKQTEATITSLKAKMADPKDIEKARKQLTTYKKQLDEMKSATEGVYKVLGNLDTASPRQLEKALRTLNSQLKNMTPGSEVWNSHVEKIKEIKARLSEIKDELKVQESWWSKLKEWVNDSGATILALGLGADAVVDTLRGFVDAYVSMDQEMANVRKFTGLTKAQVADLNEEFKKMDTRTSREALNQLAQEAGRLGKTSPEAIMGFVRAADKINVALDDIGDGATLTLSKLTGIFGDEERYGTEQALLKVGSVINELSQNCAASAPYLAQFASRMGGVGAQAKMTIPQIMAFGAVLDSNGQQVEASSTALSQVIVRMMQEPAKYARVAGLDVKKFTDMLKTDVNGALILFLETLQQAGGMDTLSPMFKDMGENGSRAIAALSTLATHIDQVKAQQQAANVAFAEGTSVSKEAAVQNGTVQASIEKAKKSLNDLRVELGERLEPLMSHMISSSSAVVRVLVTIVRFLMEYKGAIISLATAVSAYIVVANVAIIKQKTWNALCIAGKAAMFVWSAAVKLGAAAVALFSGNVRKAHLIWNVFARSLKTNPLGLLIATITAAVGLIVTFASKTAKATTEAERLARAQKRIADAEKEVEANCAVELKTLEALYNATQDQNLAMDQRLNAVARLQEQYPAYFKNLSTETILAGNAANAYERLRQSIIRSAQAEARRNLLVETESDIAKVERERDRKVSAALSNVTIPDNQRAYYPFGDEGLEMYVNSHPELIITKRYIDQVRADASKQLAQLGKERDLLGTSVAKDVVEDTKTKPNPTHTPPVGNYSPSPGSGQRSNEDRFAREKAWREKEEAEARIAYAKGETTYSEHTSKMAAIAVDYYQKLLDRKDLSASERLKIEADYWEAVNKKTVSANKELLDQEDSNYQDLLDRLRENHAERLNQEDLTAAQLRHEAEYYDQVTELAELNHLQNIRDLYEKGSAEWVAADRQLQEKQLAARERKLKKMEELEKTYSSMKDQFFGDNPDEREAKYNKAFAALQVVYNRELAAAGDYADEKLRIEEAFLQAQNALRRQYGLISEEDTRNSMQRAIDSSAEWLQGEGGQALIGALSTLTSGMSSVFSGLSSLIQAELEIQTAELEKHYEREVELAQGNTYKVAKLEKKKEADIAKLKNEANKKMFAMQVIQAVAQTAQNALSAYGSAAAIPVVGYILAPIAAAMAVAAGSIQIAAIKKQQQAAETKGYSEGGFTKPGGVNEPAGIVHAGEWVASQKLLSNPVARPMIEALDYAQRTNTIGSLRSDDVSRSITANNSLVRIAEGNDSSVLMVAAAVRLSQTVDSLTGRLNEPFVTVNTVTGDKGIKQAQDEYTRLMNNITPKSKRKK